MLTPIAQGTQEIQALGHNEPPAIKENRDGYSCGFIAHQSSSLIVTRFLLKNTGHTSASVSNVALYTKLGEMTRIVEPMALASAIANNAALEFQSSVASSQALQAYSASQPNSYTVTGQGHAYSMGPFTDYRSNYTVSPDPNPAASFSQGLALGSVVGAQRRQRRGLAESDSVIANAYVNTPVETGRMNHGNFYFQTHSNDPYPVEFVVDVVNQDGQKTRFSFRAFEKKEPPLQATRPKQSLIESELHNWKTR
jgi:hypothetical protein